LQDTGGLDTACVLPRVQTLLLTVLPCSSGYFAYAATHLFLVLTVFSVPGGCVCIQTLGRDRIQAHRLPKIEVQQVTGLHVLHRSHHVAFDLGVLCLQVRQQSLHSLALECVLAPTEITGNDGKAHFLRIGGHIHLCAVGQRPDDGVPSILRPQPGWHGLELARVQQVEHQGLDHVVPVMPQRNLGAAQVNCRTVQRPAAQTGAQRAVGLALRHLLQHDAVGVLREHLELVALRLKPV